MILLEFSPAQGCYHNNIFVREKWDHKPFNNGYYPIAFIPESLDVTEEYNALLNEVRFSPIEVKIASISSMVKDWVKEHPADKVPPISEFVLRQRESVILNLSSIKAQIFALAGYEFNIESYVDCEDCLARFASLDNRAVIEQHPMYKLIRMYYNLLGQKLCLTDYLDRILED